MKIDCLNYNINYLIDNIIKNDIDWIIDCKENDNVNYLIYELRNIFYINKVISIFDTITNIYNIKDNSLILNLRICHNNKLQFIINELSFMIKYHKYCNLPKDIVIYTNTIINSDFPFTIIKTKLNNTSIIVYKEDKYELHKYGDIYNNNKKFIEEFYKECNDDFEKFNFNKIKNVNIRYFPNSSNIRLSKISTKKIFK